MGVAPLPRSSVVGQLKLTQTGLATQTATSSTTAALSDRSKASFGWEGGTFDESLQLPQ
jgi:hypothetical protein